MDNVFRLPSLHEIKKSAERISAFIHRTPVFTSGIIDEITACNIYFKCENLQKSGAFKFRGATNALLNLKDVSPNIPVTTHSSGNHAGALAKASQAIGRKCIVVMPENAPKVKIEAVKYYNAEIVFCKPTLEARESSAEKVIEETGAVLIHPYNNYHIIAGQGTAALELLEDYSELEIIIIPVGGGGLLSGSSISAKAIKPAIKVFGAEPMGADDAYRSLKAGKIIPSIKPVTIADGLLTSLGDLTFEAISSNVDDIFCVSEESIIEAMRMVWKFTKMIIEPSSAVPLAAVLENKSLFKNKKLGIIISGGNVDLNKLPF